MSVESVILYRPVGQRELELIRDAHWRAFPPRLESQPIFYPVVSEEYAVKIARDWNTNDPHSNYVGFVTRFSVRKEYLGQFDLHEAGGRRFVEYWIPANKLDEFNSNLVGTIEMIHEFRGPEASKP